MRNDFLKILIFSFSLLLFNSCDDKSCEEIICGFNEICQGGICICENGYEGANCDEFSSEKYRGQYGITQSCSQGTGTFVGGIGTIEADGNPVNELLFFNFLNLGQTAYAYIATDQSGKGNYLRFPSQNLGSSQIVGEGYYEDFGTQGRIRIDIQLTYNGQLSNCSYTYY